MRRRLTVASTFIAILLALTVPATTFATSGFGYRKLDNFCDGLEVHFKVQFWAGGDTSANKLTSDSWVQRAQLGQAWKTIKTLRPYAYTYAIDGKLHGIWSTRSYEAKSENYWYRIQFKLRAWHDSTLLKQYVVTSIEC